MDDFKVESGFAKAAGKAADAGSSGRGDTSQTVNAWETESQIDTVEIAADANAAQGAGATFASLSGLLRPQDDRGTEPPLQDALSDLGHPGTGATPESLEPAPVDDVGDAVTGGTPPRDAMGRGVSGDDRSTVAGDAGGPSAADATAGGEVFANATNSPSGTPSGSAADPGDPSSLPVSNSERAVLSDAFDSAPDAVATAETVDTPDTDPQPDTDDAPETDNETPPRDPVTEPLTLQQDTPLAEDAQGGTTVATLDLADAQDVVFELTDSDGVPIDHPAFGIEGDRIVLRDDASVDYEVGADIPLFVRAVEDGTAFDPVGVEIDLADVSEIVTLGDGGETFRDAGVTEIELRGGGGADTIIGSAGDDLFTGGGGDDALRGSAGLDTARYSGRWSDYDITRDGADQILRDTRPGSPDGTDTLRGVETLSFSDRTLSASEALNDAPTLSVVGSNIAEGAFGAIAGTANAQDSDAGDVVTLTVDDNRFEIVDGILRLREEAALDFEKDGDAVDVTVTATDLHNAQTQEVVTLRIDDVPESIQLGRGGRTFTDAGVSETEVRGGSGDDRITGNAGDDRLIGAAGADRLSGEAGDDDLTGGGEDDMIAGGSGTDTAHWSGALSNYAIALEDGTFTVTDLIGDDGSDSVAGVELFDFGGTVYSLAQLRVEAARQSDTPPDAPYLAGDAAVGEDATEGAVVGQILGGDPDGNPVTYVLTDASGRPVDDPRFEVVGDQIRVRSGAEFDFETSGVHSVFVTAQTAFKSSAPTEMAIGIEDRAEVLDLGDEGVDFTDTGVAETAIRGGDGSDRIAAHVDGSDLAGGAGDDTLTGTLGSDRLDGGAGSDTLFGGDWDDTLTGGDGDDRLHGGEGFNRIDGGEGRDTAIWDRDVSKFEISYDEAGDRFSIVDPVGLSHSDEVTGVEVFEFAGVTYDAGALREISGMQQAPLSDPRLASGGSVEENASAGVVVARLETTGGDGPVTFTLTDETGAPVRDERFEIAGDEIRVRPGAEIDFETTPELDLFVTAADDSGSSQPEPIRITVEDMPESDPVDAGQPLMGTELADTLEGTSGEDRIFGGAGDDLLFGGEGDASDTLFGGAGFDELDGGGGNDVYVVGTGEDWTMISDGGEAWTDTLLLEGVGRDVRVLGDTVSGDGWTMVLDRGSSVTAQDDVVLDLSDDSSGLLTFDDGSSVDFIGIDRVTW